MRTKNLRHDKRVPSEYINAAELSNIKVTGNAEPKDDDLPETFVAFSRAATG